MTPFYLQEELIKELEKLFEGTNVKVFSQDLPLFEQTQDYTDYVDKKTTYFPVAIVRLISGETENKKQDNMYTVTVNIIFGTYDPNNNLQGYKDLINMLDKTIEYLLKKRIFGGYYELERNIKWQLEEDEFPHYYATIETEWILPKVTLVEDKYC